MFNQLKQIQLPAEISSLRTITEFVHSGAQLANFPESDLDRLDLVMEEVVVNVINYAYPDGQPGNIEVSYAIEGLGKLFVQVSDAGREFDPLAKDPPDLRLGLAERPIGGLGIFLVKRIARSISYSRVDNRNVLSFHLEAES
jgi:anti-sigma regulatory factor (Ser/Thr protein kinase)